MEVLYKETDVIGKKISTKSVGWNRRNDITDEYKYKEGISYFPLFVCFLDLISYSLFLMAAKYWYAFLIC